MANFYPKQSASFPYRANSILISTSASAPSTTFAAQTRQIRVTTNVTGGVYIKIGDAGSSATAVTDSFVAANNFPEYFSVTPGQIISACTTSTTTGVCSVTEMT